MKLCILINLGIILACVQTTCMLNITIGFLVPVTGKRSYGHQLDTIARIAVDDINNDPTLTSLRSNNVALKVIIRDTECDTGHGVFGLVDILSKGLLGNITVGGFIGKILIGFVVKYD